VIEPKWYELDLTDASQGQPSFIEYMGLATNPNTESLIGTAVGLFYAGGVFGCVLNAYLADKIGRKWTAIVAAVILLIATGCLAGSVNIGMFIAFRFFVGVGYAQSGSNQVAKANGMIVPTCYISQHLCGSLKQCLPRVAVSSPA
jgi:MFS family permease